MEKEQKNPFEKKKKKKNLKRAMKIRFLNNEFPQRNAIKAFQFIHYRQQRNTLVPYVALSLNPLNKFLASRYPFLFAFSSVVHALFPPSSPDTRSRNQRVEPRTIRQCDPPPPLSFSPSSSSLSLSMLSFFFSFPLPPLFFLSRGGEKRLTSHENRWLRSHLIIGIEFSFEERSSLPYFSRRTYMDIRICYYGQFLLSFFFFYLDRRGESQSSKETEDFYRVSRAFQRERTDDGLFLFPQFRRFGELGVRDVSCWSSVTYFFFCVYVYIYIFFSREGKREKLGEFPMIETWRNLCCNMDKHLAKLKL